MNVYTFKTQNSDCTQYLLHLKKRIFILLRTKTKSNILEVNYLTQEDTLRCVVRCSSCKIWFCMKRVEVAVRRRRERRGRKLEGKKREE